MERADLLFWRKVSVLLKEGNTGRSFNSILKMAPNVICISDASKFALGGFFAIGDHSFAWRFKLPSDLQSIYTLNLLEFIAAYWTMKIPAKQIRDVKSLNITNSTDALSWMAKNNHRPDLQLFHDEVGQRFGLTLFETNSSADGRHLAGERNKISDSLSRDTHMPLSTTVTATSRDKGQHAEVLRYLSGKRGRALLLAARHGAKEYEHKAIRKNAFQASWRLVSLETVPI